VLAADDYTVPRKDGFWHAQDPFETHVYEYEPLATGKFTLETHLNYVGIGAKTTDSTVAPTTISSTWLLN
jgi:hypothetical protein